MAANKRRFDRSASTVGVATRHKPPTKHVMDAPDGLDTRPAGENKLPLSPSQRTLKQLAHDKRAVFGMGVLCLFVVIALLGPPIYQHIGGIYSSDLSGSIGPAVYHHYAHEELSQQDQFLIDPAQLN